jgi:hypothetical protein
MNLQVQTPVPPEKNFFNVISLIKGIPKEVYINFIILLMEKEKF